MNLLGSADPQATALVLDDGAVLSYGALDAEVARCQRVLQGRSLIFCLCHNDLPSLVAYLAALRASLVPLLLPGNLDEAALAKLVQTYEPRYLVHQRSELALPGWSAPLWQDRGTVLQERQSHQAAPLHDDLALLLTTSGSTGSPKLVRLSHSNLLANADSIARYLELDAHERAITSLPMHYSYGLSVVNSHLRVGASLVLTDRSLMDPQFWTLLRDQQVSSMAGVPYLYDMLLKLRLERLDLGSVRTLTQAGGRLAPEKIRQVHAACATKGVRFITMYGQTEATARIAYLPAAQTAAKAGAIGHAIPGGDLWLEDEARARISATGVTGELVYSGPNVSLGYAETRQDLALGDERCGLLRTGDLAQRDEDGHFWIVGRKSRFIKLYGNRVALDAVETLLQAEGLECAATGDDTQLVVGVSGVTPSAAAALRQSLALRLGIHPVAIRVLGLPALPRLDSGKVNYPALRAHSKEAA
jgi:long-chain acyl-CoA synthetase